MNGIYAVVAVGLVGVSVVLLGLRVRLPGTHPDGSAPLPAGTATPQVSGPWLAPDVAASFALASNEWRRRHGHAIPLASAGRTMADEVNLAGFYGPHAAGEAVDVSYATMDVQTPGWSRDELDSVLAMFVPPLLPLQNDRASDPNHYQKRSYIGSEAALESAVKKIGNWDPLYAGRHRSFA